MFAGYILGELTDDEPLVQEEDGGRKRKVNPVVAEKSKNAKSRPADSKRANLTKTMQNVMGAMTESANMRVMLNMMQMQQESQANSMAQIQSQFNAQMQAQMQAQMHMMQMMNDDDDNCKRRPLTTNATFRDKWQQRYQQCQ